jgi:hypothetical protein
MTGLLRLGLLLVALLVCGALIAAHGVRGIILVIAIMMAATLPQTRAWRVTEHALVRLTGTRRRAAVLLMAIVVGVLIAVNVYQFTQ